MTAPYAVLLPLLTLAVGYGLGYVSRWAQERYQTALRERALQALGGNPRWEQWASELEAAAQKSALNGNWSDARLFRDNADETRRRGQRR